MPTLQVFAPRSAGIGVAGGVLVAGALGQLVGAAWGLAILNGLTAGILVLAGAICMRHGKFAFLLESAHQRQFGVGILVSIVMVSPMLLVDNAIGTELFNRGDALALNLLFAITGITAYTLGGIMLTLAHLDVDAAAADPRLRRVAPPTSEHGPMPRVHTFTARSTGIGSATGVLVGLVLEQLGAAYGLAVLNGLAAGALALALSIDGQRGGWFNATDHRRPGIRALAYAVMMAPTLFVHYYIELPPADEIAVSLLFMLTGFAAYTLGGIMATLAYQDTDPAPAEPPPASCHPAARDAPRLVASSPPSSGPSCTAWVETTPAAELNGEPHVAAVAHAAPQPAVHPVDAEPDGRSLAFRLRTETPTSCEPTSTFAV